MKKKGIEIKRLSQETKRVINRDRPWRKQKTQMQEYTECRHGTAEV